MGVLLDLRQHLQRTQNRQAGANQRKKLLVEDEERLKLDLAPRHAPKAAARPDREDVIAGMGKARTQLLGGGRGLHLLLHAAALIGQLDDELCHSSETGDAQGLRLAFLFKVNSFAHMIDAESSRIVRLSLPPYRVALPLRVLKFLRPLTVVFCWAYAGLELRVSPMDHTTRWMQARGEGLPPAQPAERGNWLGMSPRTAALMVLILLGTAVGTSYLTRFQVKFRNAVAPAPYPHELARVSFAVAGDVIPHEAVRAAAEAAGGGGARVERPVRRCERRLQGRRLRIREHGNAGRARPLPGVEAVHVRRAGGAARSAEGQRDQDRLIRQ